MNHQIPWKKLSSRSIYKNPWITVREDEVITPTSKKGIYGVVENKPFVLIIPVTEAGLILVKQFRYPLNKFVWEFPAGSIEEGESPLQAAKRELQEEIAMSSRKWRNLGFIHEAVSTNKTEGTIFKAKELIATLTHKQTEDGIEFCREVSFNEFSKMIKAGEIDDAKTLAAYLRFLNYS